MVIKYYMSKKREKEFDRGVHLRQTETHSHWFGTVE